MPYPLVPAGTRITNAYNKETFVFTHPVDDTAPARFDVVLGAGGTGGGNAVPHIHPKTDEVFYVHSGRVMVMIDGVEHFGEPGDSVTVPAGATHFFKNAHDGETHMTVSFTVEQQHLRFFLDLAAATVLLPQAFKRDGAAKLLPTALKLHLYSDHLYVAGPPIWVQKALFATLAPLARLVGYRLLVPPQGEPSFGPDLAPVQSSPAAAGQV